MALLLGAQSDPAFDIVSALAAAEEAIKCSPSEKRYAIAFMSACNAGDVAKAKLYWSKLPPSRAGLKQLCVRNGINL